MTEILLIILVVLVAITLLVSIFKKPKLDITNQIGELKEGILKFQLTIEKIEKSLADEFQRNRKEMNDAAKTSRDELSNSLKDFNTNFTNNIKDLTDKLKDNFSDFSKQLTDSNKQNLENIKEVRDNVDKQLKNIREDNTKQLDEMRKTVDEKLQKTLNDRLSQSFETVGKQLQAVQEGLGEMKNLASDVGGLKKVLGNVKMRGGLGEVQLEMLLEQILAPDQYEKNVATKKGSSDVVEFAIKLPGKDDLKSTVYLPVDAKFPSEVYEKVQDAYEEGDSDKIVIAQKQLVTTIKNMAKDIKTKYLDPPNTTDFGIMFLPFEGIYAEVVRKVALFEELQRDYKIIVTGPTTLAAILNSLQMGFKTLAIEKRSSEVWQVLGAVKKEFENFGGMMEKAQKNIQTGMNQLDEVMGKRTRAINRKLKDVETLSEVETAKILPELSDPSTEIDEE